MKHEPTDSVRIDPDDLMQLIEACQYASNRLTQVIFPIGLHGRVQQEWAHDEVSLEVARYYDDQIFHGQYNNYAALNDYQQELTSTINTLRQILADYQDVDAAIGQSLERL